MEFPDHHHHHHHHHHRRNDEEERETYAPPQTGANFAAVSFPPPQTYHPEPQFGPRAPPPPYSNEPYPPSSYEPQPHFAAPPPPFFGQVTHIHHNSGETYTPPENRYGGYAAPQPPNPIFESQGGDAAGFSHISHHHSQHAHTSNVFGHRHEENRTPENIAGLAVRPPVRVYCKAEPNYYLTIRDGKVILAPSDHSDEAQHWYKDEKFSTRVKDAEGCPCFALVNKATGEAIKHSIGETQPVQLIPYDPDRLDESVLWTESKDLGDGYRTIRMVNNIRLNVDAYHGDERSGGVHDGTLIVLWTWNKGDNQRWKIVPF